MQSNLFLVPALVSALALTACAHDKKKSSHSPTIEFARLAQVQYSYGDYFTGYKRYTVDTEKSLLKGSWDQVVVDDSPHMGRAQAEKTLSVEDLTILAQDIHALNGTFKAVDKSRCGIISDPSAPVLTLRDHDATSQALRIAEAGDVGDFCADAYIGDGGLNALFAYFDERLPQPQDPAEYKDPWKKE